MNVTKINKLLIFFFGVTIFLLPFGIALFDGIQVIKAQTEEGIVLFFNDRYSGKVVPVTRLVSGKVDIKILIDELLKGPKAADSLYLEIPKGTALLGYEPGFRKPTYAKAK